MNGDHDFDTVVYQLKQVHVTSRDNPATVYLHGGQGLADDDTRSPEMVACACNILPTINEYCYVEGRSVRREDLYRQTMQYVGDHGGAHPMQYFVRRN